MENRIAGSSAAGSLVGTQEAVQKVTNIDSFIAESKTQLADMRGINGQILDILIRLRGEETVAGSQKEEASPSNIKEQLDSIISENRYIINSIREKLNELEEFI